MRKQTAKTANRVPDPNRQQFIVAEVTKNWREGRDGGPSEEVLPTLLSERFELVVETNLRRGYRLHDWKLSQVFVGETLLETIVAIFEREDSELKKPEDPGF